MIFCEKIKTYAPQVVDRLGRVPERINPLFRSVLQRTATAVLREGGETPTPDLVAGVVLYSLRLLARSERHERIAAWTFRTFVGELPIATVAQ